MGTANQMKSKVGFEEWRKLGYLERKPLKVEKTKEFCFSTVLIAICLATFPLSTRQVQFVDVILCNRYYAWYQDCGQTQLISRQLEIELRNWFDTFHKPVVQSEYGADTVAGLHMVGCSGIFHYPRRRTTRLPAL